MKMAHTVAVSVFLLLAAGGAWAVEPKGAQPAYGFDVSLLDRTTSACTDFYQFACGGWMAANPLPADKPRYGRFDELQERNLAVLRDILEKASRGGPERDAVDLRIGDYYAACMDEAAIDKLGLAPLQPELARIAALRDKADIAPLLAHLHELGVEAFFTFGADQDFKDPTSVIAQADQGGLGLPDRDYYVKEDERSRDLRQKYVAHVQRVFELAGDAPARAADGARLVMEIETALAKASLDRVSRRDPDKIYHRMTLAELGALAPSLLWNRYLEGVSAPPVARLNVAVPEFMKGVETILGSTSLDALKTYLRWQLLRTAAPTLPTPFVEARFDFYGRTLQGTKEERPRWKRCTTAVDGDLGEALGRRYVDQTFGPEGKARMKVMVDALERALGQDIRALPWMTEVTRTAAIGKLTAIANKIGHPDSWRDYSAYQVKRDDALGNSLRGNVFNFHRQVAKIGKPVDRQEWLMTPPTVNAYYNPQMNDINFPAGILQPPFFDRAMDDGVNFGGIGAVIGHELTHGFDDQGRRFAADGSLTDWWTRADAKAFEEKAQCIVDEYDAFTAVGDVKLNGRLTLGENVADNGGLRIALMALEDVLVSKPTPPIDGFTQEQRLFLGWAGVWCQNATDEVTRLRAQTDPHSPGRWRVNGVVSNMPEFQKAFACSADAPMVRPKPCRVW